MQEKTSSSTWLLFASGKYAAIDTYLYPASPESSRPIDAYIVSECQGDFTKTARRAADLVYHTFQAKHKIKSLVVGYDIQTHSGEALTGRSGGLIFAAALLKALMLSTGYKDPGDIAATGEILARGNIGPIIAINPKITSALHLLEAGSWFFYPKDNQKEIDKTLLTQLQAKGVHVKAIANITELVDTLTSTKPKQKSQKRRQGYINKSIPTFGVLLIISFIIGLVVFFSTGHLSKQSISNHKTTQKVQQLHNKVSKSEATLSPRKLKTKINHAEKAVAPSIKPAKETQTFRFAPPIK